MSGYTFGVVVHTVQIGAFMRSGWVRARINAPRISAGNCSIGGVVGVDGVSDSEFVSGVFSSVVISDGKNFFMILDIKCGTGMANRGFCVLITIDVVAIYNGIVEIIIKQNVSPPIPRKCACEMRIQSI